MNIVPSVTKRDSKNLPRAAVPVAHERGWSDGAHDLKKFTQSISQIQDVILIEQNDKIIVLKSCLTHFHIFKTGAIYSSLLVASLYLYLPSLGTILVLTFATGRSFRRLMFSSNNSCFEGYSPQPKSSAIKK